MRTLLGAAVALALINLATPGIAQDRSSKPGEKAPSKDRGERPRRDNQELESGGRQAELESRIEAVEDDMESVLGIQDRLVDQIKQNRLHWSGAYRMVVNNFHFVDDSIDRTLDHLELVLDTNHQPILDPATRTPIVQPAYKESRRNIDKWFGGNWLHRMRLTMRYDLADNLRFYGQLGVFKYMNEFKDHPPDLDMHANRYPRDQSVRLERAYIDWFITDWLVLTAGRVASPEGPPAELKENTVRNATWGVQMVEAELEAVLVTLHLSRFLESSYLRVFYIPFGVHPDASLQDDTTLFRSTGIDPMHAWGAMLELKFPYLGDNLWQLGFVQVAEFRPRPLPLNLPGQDPIQPESPTGQDLGQFLQANALLELKDIAGSGLDIFAAYTLTYLQPGTARMVYKIPLASPLDVVNPYLNTVVSQFPGPLTYETGLASYDSGETFSLGHMFYVGFRYTLPRFGAYAPRFGAELNHGTKYHVPFASPSDLLVNRLATKGWAWEAYYIQQLVPEVLFMRIGFIQLLREYSGQYIGPTSPLSQRIENTYVLLDATW